MVEYFGGVDGVDMVVGFYLVGNEMECVDGNECKVDWVEFCGFVWLFVIVYVGIVCEEQVIVFGQDDGKV